MREHRVARGERVVVELLRARHESLAVARREEEAAALLVREELDREPREPVGLFEPPQLARGDVQLEQAVGDVRVVVQEAGPAGAAGAQAPTKPAFRGGQRAEQELAQPPRGLDPLRPLEPPPRLGERGEREPVPGGDRLVVAQRLRPLLAPLEEAPLQLGIELAADDRAAVLERLQQLGRHALLLGPREGRGPRPRRCPRPGPRRSRPPRAGARAAGTRPSPRRPRGSERCP